MKRYYRIMLGAKSIHADECYKGNFIGAGFGIEQDLSKHLPDNWREFNLEDDLRIRRALSVAHNIEFYRYQISFKLFKH